MGRRSGLKAKARKKVTVKLLARTNAGQVVGAYRIMEKLIEDHHSHLRGAKIAIAWRFGWKADADGRIKLGQAKKGSDLDRELHHNDFVILLNHERWNMANFSEEQMAALLDHELCHCQVSCDANGEPKTDEIGRTVYRLRKHDVEEFRDVVARHGLWKDDLVAFADSAAKKTHRPLLDRIEENGDEADAKDRGKKPAKKLAKK